MKKGRKQERREQAAIRQSAYDSLSLDEKIERARRRGGKKELERLLAKRSS